jgi:hypothetical protein
MISAVRKLCRRLGAWLLHLGEARPFAWRRLREVEPDAPAMLRTRQHLWRRVARELGHRAIPIESSL